MYGLGDQQDIVLPALDYTSAYYDPAGNVIIPGTTGGWSVLTPSGALNQGSGAAPLNAGTISGGIEVLGSPLPQSSTGSFGTSQTSGISNTVLAIGGGLVGLVFLLAMMGGRR